ncbi:MAG: hypothetical protein ACI4MH_00875 [Candidatus Coproplasma sp.]
MEDENKLEYYLADLTEETLFAYGSHREFFRTYDKESGKWVVSKISYSRFLHDFWYREISEEQAKELTGGNLPTDDYKKYRQNV